MKGLAARLEAPAAWLFADGWRFLVPYQLALLAALVTGVGVPRLRLAFLALHAAAIPLLLLLAVRRRGAITAPAALAWAGLALVFLLPGAYLEFPSDAWEHLRRLYAEQGLQRLDEPPGGLRMAYFLGYSLVGGVAVAGRRLALGLLAAAWQMLLAFAVYRFARRVGFGPRWAFLQVVASVALMGTGPFAFYRYYALSSTPLAYAAYLAALGALLDVARGRLRPGLLDLLLATLLVAGNHRQELLFLAISAAGVALSALTARRAAAWLGAGLLALASLALLARLAGLPAALPAGPGSGSPHFAAWGAVRLLDPRLPYLGTLGYHGLLGLALAPLLWRRQPLLCWLTLLPPLLLLFPPAVWLVAALHGSTPAPMHYRLLFAFPTSFLLVAGLRQAVARLRARGLRVPVAVAAVPLLAFGALGSGFAGGRLWFQLLRPGDAASLVPLDATAEWLESQRLARGAWRPRELASIDLAGPAPPPSTRCLVVSDAATSFALAAQLGFVTFVELSLIHI